MSTDNQETCSPCGNTGCTFFGRPATGGFCSKCYKEKIQRDAAATSTTSVAATSPAAPTTSEPAAGNEKGLVTATTTPSGPEAATTVSENTKRRKVQENRSRCFSCNKKIGLTGIECKCGYVYCGAHRYPDTHACDFDFKKHDRDLLAKANEKVISEKVERL